MGDMGSTYYIQLKLGIDTATAVEGYMPASHAGAPKCPPITSRCDCNKHGYYWHKALVINTPLKLCTGAWFAFTIPKL